jgi:hypothetical protein
MMFFGSNPISIKLKKFRSDTPCYAMNARASRELTLPFGVNPQSRFHLLKADDGDDISSSHSELVALSPPSPISA